MADMSTPAKWDKPDRPSRRHASSAEIAAGAGSHEKGSREAFLWPTPPYASYPSATEQTETLPCQLMTGSQAERKFTSARLTFFVPDTGVAHLQMPPARTTVAVRFDQFSALILTTPLQPLPLPLADPHAELLSQRRARISR
jgi:hypothetical protein